MSMASPAFGFPEESAEYRKARNELLAAEIELRREMEAVAAARRKLPLGGRLAQDYIFDEGPADLSEQGEFAKRVFPSYSTPKKRAFWFIATCMARRWPRPVRPAPPFWMG